MFPHTRRARLAAGICTGALALSSFPVFGLANAGAATPTPPPADPVAKGAFCDEAPSTNPFEDLNNESASTRQVILCLVATGLTQGKTDTTYAPGESVNRRQMALFIKRLADLLERNETGSTDLAKLPAYDGEEDHSDIDDQSDAVKIAIGQLTQAGIIGGFPDGTYRPNADVTRRQMAKFIAELVDFLGDPLTVPDGADYFDDDDGDPGEADLNKVAAAGIFQGDGKGNVAPGIDISRRQMANVLLRTAQVFFADGDVKSPFIGSNQDFEVTPSATVRLDEGSTRDFTANGLDDDVAYDIALFRCANVMIDGDGAVTFDAQGDAAPDNAEADTGGPAAELTTVNGADTDSGDGIDATDGTVTFTITSDATECVRPVVFADDEDDDTLNIGAATKRPTDPFGVGGETQFVPAESPDSFPAGNTVSLVGTGFAVVNSGTVYFRSGDIYRIGGTQAGGPAFFTALSTGDGLTTCAESQLPSGGTSPAPYDQDGPNEFCLTDSAPNNPTNLAATAGTPASTAVDLAWTAADPADAYNIYANPDSCADTDETDLRTRRVATISAANTTFTVTGLTKQTTYCFVVTTVEEGDESTLAGGADTNQIGQENTGNNRDQLATADTVEAPTITSAVRTTDASPAGQFSVNDVATLTFSEAMNPGTVNGATFAVLDPDGDTTTITCGASPTPGNGVTAASCSLNGDGTALTITATENGDDANSGGDGTLAYPLDITASTGITDADDGRTVDIAGSADTRIG